MGETSHIAWPYFGVPPARQPRPAATEPTLTGKRLVLSTPEGFVYDHRAASEIITDGQGGAFIEVVTEEQWFFDTPENHQPAARWPVHLVWVE